MSQPRAPWLARALGRLIVGEDADIVRGDLDESFHHRASERGDSARTRLEHIADVAVTVAHCWWFAFRGGAEQLFTKAAFQHMGGEMRQILRGLMRRPGYAAIVILTLALGIGATTTIYTLVDVMLVKPLPYRDADRLVVIGNTDPTRPANERNGLTRLETMSRPNLELLRARTRVFDRVGMLERNQWVSGDRVTQTTELLDVAAVNDALLDMLGVKPLMGRLLRPGDSPVNGEANVVITYESWQRRFGGDPNVIGKVTPGGMTFTVVGVLPKEFHQPAALVGTDVEYWVYIDPTDRRYQQARRRNLHVLAHLAPGVTIERAQRELSVAQAQVARESPEGNQLPGGQSLGVDVHSLRDETVGSAGRPALLILGASVLLLLLACTNASNLLVVRGLERAGEMALRRAIGAGRARLTAGLVFESTTLAVLGGILGLGFAAIGVGVFRRFGPSSIPLVADVAVNPRIAAAGFLLSLLVGLVIGAVPAVRGGGVDLLSSLRSSALAVTPSGSRLRATLAATQLALALILGVGATLLFRSFVQIKSQPLGFQPERIVSFMLPIKASPMWEVWDRVIPSLQAIPGVTSVAIASNVPLQTPSWMPRVQAAEQTQELSSAAIPGYAVTPGYFTTMGTRLVAGRPFGPADQPESPPVTIVNQTFARTVFPGRSPIGARIAILGDDDRVQREVVGIVEDVVQARIPDGIAPAIYVPHTQRAAIGNVVLQTSRSTSSVALERDIRRAIADAGFSMVPPLSFESMSSRIAATYVTPRFNALLIAAFAAAAIVLSAVGLYGTLAFAVRSRRKELGIRIALGAAPGQIHAIVVRQTVLIFAIGSTAGLIGALLLTRLLEGYLYRLSTVDPLSFLAAIAVAGGVVLVAALMPAVRAGRIDPMSSIRVET